MRNFWSAISLALLINALALLGLVGWLWQSGRLDRSRLTRIYRMLEVTTQQEQARIEQARREDEAAQKQAQEASRLLAVGNTPVTGEDRLAGDERNSQILAQRLDRLQRDRQDLLRQLELAKDQIAKQRAALEIRQKALDEQIAAELKQRDDRDFQQAVQVYEQLKPKQTKEIFQELLRQNKTQQVVDYLAAMQLRKAAGVLKEFKTREEVAQATDLVQRLRMRGIDPLMRPGTATPAGQSADGSEGGSL